MSSDLRELYQDVILEHSRKPRNYRAIEGGRRCEGHNPLCGDQVVVYVKMDGDKLEDVSFEGSGCAISTASASVMTETVKGKSKDEAEELFRLFHDLVTRGRKPPGRDLGKLAVFAGVSEFPVRVKCATLAWHTLRAALEGKDERVSTE
ncbi:MAG: iron-sulfur cluster assembly scaffold protein [Candidatus Binatia bacterium]|nr:MAG: iron-sulfur cluster assembly scaffold protein [Candidatus Binatia bacterium]